MGEHGQVGPEEAAVVVLPVHRIQIGEDRQDGHDAEGERHQQALHAFAQELARRPAAEGEPDGGARDEKHQRHEEFAEERRDRHDARVRRPLHDASRVDREDRRRVHEDEHHYRKSPQPVDVVAPLSVHCGFHGLPPMSDPIQDSSH